MLVLSLTTAHPSASVALVNDATVLTEINFWGERGHAARLPLAVDFALRQTQFAPRDCRAIVVGNGPGSFTGLRIGLSFAKGLAESLGISLVLVSTLHGLAAQISDMPGYIVPVLDAKRDEFYTAVFVSEEGDLRRVSPDVTVKRGEWSIYLQNLGVERCWLTGDAADEAARLGPYRAVSAGLRLPRAGVLAVLARDLPLVDPRYARPNYLRPSAARPKQGGAL